MSRIVRGVTDRYNLTVKELFSGWRYAWSNFLSNWQFLSVVGIGVLVASILLAVGPIYASAMTDLGLRYRLNTGLETTREQIARSDTYLLQINDAADSAMRDTIDVITAERIGWLGTDEEPYGGAVSAVCRRGNQSSFGRVPTEFMSRKSKASSIL